MNLRLRYLSALVVNVALPWLAYRLAFPHVCLVGALAVSALPLIAWMIWDLLAHRHFDALSAIVLVGIARPRAWTRACVRSKSRWCPA